MNDNPDKKIIKEKIDEVEIKTIIDLFYSDKISLKEDKLVIDYDTVGKEIGFSKDLCNDLYATKDFSFLYIYYKNKEIPQYFKTVEIYDQKNEIEVYEIYRFETCQNIIKEKKFQNPFIIANGKVEEFHQLQKIFSGLIQKFAIFDSEIIDYSTYFKKDEEKADEKDGKKNEEKNEEKKVEQKKDEIIGFSISPNFDYYFKYPDPNEKFSYHLSSERKKLFQSGEKEKVRGICGNFGIGKSTSFLSTRVTHPEVIYLNLKALIKNENNIVIWKYKILLREIAFSFCKISSYEIFSSLKKQLEKKIIIWECIEAFINFAIKNNIKIELVLDQYKEKYDNNYSHINAIINTINGDQNKENIIRLIISSSINNKDVRRSLLELFLGTKSPMEKPLFKYIYIFRLFDFEKIIEEDTSLSQVKKDMLKKIFNNIPRFYYDIKYIDDKDLQQYVLTQEKKIYEKIKLFYEENELLSFDNTLTLIKYRQNIGKTLKEDDSKKLLPIIPFKYFIYEKKIIEFYFSLVETQFDNFLSERSCEFLKYPPISGLKESVIGDILEFILINDLKNNKFDNFQEIFKVDSIWDLNKIESANTNDIKNKNILILQTNPNATYVDIGILIEGENLILIQCKKALKNPPKEYITKDIVFKNRNDIKNKFYSKLNVTIKKISLMYVTGITVFNDEENNEEPFRTWGNKKSESFDELEKMCRIGECVLLFYDPANKKYYLKCGEAVPNSIDSIINNFDNFNSVDIENNNKEFKKEEQFHENIKKYKDINNINMYDIIRRKEESENFFDNQELSIIKKEDIPINTNILGICDNPETKNFMIDNLFIGFKRKKKKFLLYKENNKKRKIYEISATNILINEEKDSKIFQFLEKEKIDKCYYMEKKNEK